MITLQVSACLCYRLYEQNSQRVMQSSTNGDSLQFTVCEACTSFTIFYVHFHIPVTNNSNHCNFVYFLKTDNHFVSPLSQKPHKYFSEKQGSWFNSYSQLLLFFVKCVQKPFIAHPVVTKVN